MSYFQTQRAIKLQLEIQTLKRRKGKEIEIKRGKKKE